MRFQIRKAAVIGSGVMGASIAAHLANAGLTVYLFDMVPEQVSSVEQQQGLTREHPQVRYRLVEENKQKLLKQNPPPLFTPEKLSLIIPCNLEDDLCKLTEVDWIIEAVIEKMEVKQKVLAQVEWYRAPECIVSSNTSGLSVEEMVTGRSETFKRYFLGTHFFNPPRYMKLLEIIPTSKTDEQVLQFIQEFAMKRLGKGVVRAKDTPNFIANRIGVYGLMVTIQEMLIGGYSIGEVDSITGSALGRAKSATFRTLDLVGLETFAYVVNHLREKVQDEAEKKILEIPECFQKMIDKGWLGQKTGRGFYLKTAQGIQELDIEHLEYVPRNSLQAPSLNLSKQEKNVEKQLRTLLYAQDRAGKLAWQITKKTLLYAANKIGEIADSPRSIDQALKWGFGWSLGPFELWEKLGLEDSIAKMEAEGEEIPTWIRQMLSEGEHHFYKQEEGQTYVYQKGGYHLHPVAEQELSLKRLRDQGQVIKQNKGATLLDLGDGIACLEFHSPKQAIGPDILGMITESIEEVEKNYEGLVLGNQGKHFCVGANLALMLMEAQEQNWEEIERLIGCFQQVTSRIRYSSKPIVAAPFGMTLGGGTEICLPAARLQASAETYMGLVETGVGLIPGGGGTKEMLLRLSQALPRGVKLDQQALVNFAFESIAQAKVSTSAEEARSYFFLRPEDSISMNQDYLLYDAKQVVVSLAKMGYRPPLPQDVTVVGEPGKSVLQLTAYQYYSSGYLSKHDLKIAGKLAHVLCGGNLPAGAMVDEQYLLDLEREAFLSLIGEPKTQERMLHMLKKGKPLRN